VKSAAFYRSGSRDKPGDDKQALLARADEVIE
jgi:hypothetical protein